MVVETVVKAVLAHLPYTVKVVQTYIVILCTAELPVVPERNDVLQSQCIMELLSSYI